MPAQTHRVCVEKGDASMLENLIQTLPETRAPLLRQELVLLHRFAERFFSEPEDRALAEVSDFQGVGGNREQN